MQTITNNINEIMQSKINKLDNKEIIRARHFYKGKLSNGIFYRSPVNYELFDGKYGALYFKKKLEFYADIPTSTHDIGIKYRGVFIPLFKSNPMLPKDMRLYLDKFHKQLDAVTFEKNLYVYWKKVNEIHNLYKIELKAARSI